MSPRNIRMLRVSAVLTLVGLGFMVWAVLRPTPMPTILAMSLGQLIGTSAFAIYLFVVVLDIRRVPGRRTTVPPAVESAAPPPVEAAAPPPVEAAAPPPPVAAAAPPPDKEGA